MPAIPSLIRRRDGLSQPTVTPRLAPLAGMFALLAFERHAELRTHSSNDPEPRRQRDGRMPSPQREIRLALPPFMPTPVAVPAQPLFYLVSQRAPS
jgi:hypothetical protein